MTERELCLSIAQLRGMHSSVLHTVAPGVAQYVTSVTGYQPRWETLLTVSSQ